MRRLIVVAALFGALGGSLTTATAADPHAAHPVQLPGLQAAAQVTRETNDIPHIRAANLHDLVFLEGYLHAQDRFFEMDYNRHLASGTLAALVGAAALPTDVQLRTFGLRRGAEASVPALSPEATAALDAYVAGVNAFLVSHPLPPEYQILHITRVDPWTAVDTLTLAKLLFFGLSFDLSDLSNTVALQSYEAAGVAAGFDGTKLFFQDVFRSAPFDPASTVPDASVPRAAATAPEKKAKTPSSATELAPGAANAGADDTGTALARRYVDQIKNLPLVDRYLHPSEHASSNEWAVSGALTTTGFPLVANDPHLSLGTPPIWYPIQLESGSMDVIGHSFAGLPFVALGHNRRIAWGATVNPVDVTDVFQEHVVPDSHSPSGLSIVHAGQFEPIIPIPEAYQVNALDGTPNHIVPAPPGSTPPAVLIVPRRNNGPIISLDQVQGSALSVQYTGSGATKELQGIIGFDEARNLDDFRAAIQFFDTGSFNFAYGDIEGNIAYLTSGEVPIREDLQRGTVNGLPPFFVRNGVSGNEWLPVEHPQPNQVLPYEILPAQEMPHIVNPPAGWFVNSNNDPVGVTLDNNPLGRQRPGGVGIYYLSPGYDGFRAGRATALIREKLTHGKLSMTDMEAMQADTVMIDSTVFTPWIERALSDAQEPGALPALAAFAADPRITDAVDRIAHWDLRTRTGIASGYDVGRPVGLPPSAQDIADSIATTTYSVWRSQFVQNTIDAPLTALHLPMPEGGLALTALRHLLDTFAVSGGVGGSGVNFFSVPAVTSAADRRDIVILNSLSDALARLASPDFAPAFGGSTNLDDYRWGKLHRIVFAHPLDDLFSVPPAGGAFPASVPGLPGIATDGGFEVLDRSDSDVRADGANAFMFDAGPSNRSVYMATNDGMTGESALPGGVSGVLGSTFYVNLLSAWLANQYYPLRSGQDELEHNILSVTKFVPTFEP